LSYNKSEIFAILESSKKEFSAGHGKWISLFSSFADDEKAVVCIVIDDSQANI